MRNRLALREAQLAMLNQTITDILEDVSNDEVCNRPRQEISQRGSGFAGSQVPESVQPPCSMQPGEQCYAQFVAVTS